MLDKIKESFLLVRSKVVQTFNYVKTNWKKLLVKTTSVILLFMFLWYVMMPRVVNSDEVDGLSGQ